METVPVTTDLDIGLFKQLESYANITSQSKNFLIADALQHYLEYQLSQIKAIKIGLEQAEANNFASDHDVRSAFQRWGVHDI
jgi:predicted transcriptional regulator